MIQSQTNGSSDDSMAAAIAQAATSLHDADGVLASRQAQQVQTPVQTPADPSLRGTELAQASASLQMALANVRVVKSSVDALEIAVSDAHRKLERIMENERR